MAGANLGISAGTGYKPGGATSPVASTASASTFNQNPNGPSRKLATDTDLGRQLGSQISDSLAGKPSNALLGAQGIGNEALARKAQDIRGMMGSQAQASGMIGQGAAAAAKQQGEFQILRNLGDFNTQMGQAAAQEQQQAVQNASTFLGQEQQDWQLNEMQRQAMVSENFKAKDDDFANLMRLIEDPVMQANGGEAYDNLLVNAYGRFQSDPAKIEEFKAGLRDNAEAKQEIAKISGWANGASPKELDRLYEFTPDRGVIDKSTGQPVSDTLAMYLSDVKTAASEKIGGEAWTKLRDPALRESMSTGDWRDVLEDPETAAEELGATQFDPNYLGNYTVGQFVVGPDGNILKVAGYNKGFDNNDTYSRTVKFIDPQTNEEMSYVIRDNRVGSEGSVGKLGSDGSWTQRYNGQWV